MDKKPKVGRNSQKTKEQKIEDKEQSERFIQAARQLDVDESEAAFDIAASKIILSKRSAKTEK